MKLSLVRHYMDIKRPQSTLNYLEEFWNNLRDNILAYNGWESRNGHRLYIKYCGQTPEVKADDSEEAGGGFWAEIRQYIIAIAQDELRKREMSLEDYDYINGTVEAGYVDLRGKVRKRTQKLGKLITGRYWKGDPILDIYNRDPVRLGKNLRNNLNNLYICISDHPYDIAGMSTGRDWTSCMNVEDGICKDYVEEDVRYGTLVAYIIDRQDLNIEHPYGRVLLKPHKLRRKGHKGFDRCPIIYIPEPTVYSSYVGLRPIRDWLKEICRTIQTGTGMLIPLKQLYNDTFHDEADVLFEGKKMI